MRSKLSISYHDHAALEHLRETLLQLNSIGAALVVHFGALVVHGLGLVRHDGRGRSFVVCGCSLGRPRLLAVLHMSDLFATTNVRPKSD